MLQNQLIDRVRVLCASDPAIVAELTYGSFPQGIGDEYSDIEFWLFFAGPVDPLSWLQAMAPYEYVVLNEFGSHVVFFTGPDRS